MHWAVLLQEVLASQMQPIQLSESPAGLGSHWYFCACTAAASTMHASHTLSTTLILATVCSLLGWLPATEATAHQPATQPQSPRLSFSACEQGVFKAIRQAALPC